MCAYEIVEFIITARTKRRFITLAAKLDNKFLLYLLRALLVRPHRACTKRVSRYTAP